MGKVVETIVGVAATAVAVVGSIAGAGNASIDKAVESAGNAAQAAYEKKDDNDAPISPRGTSGSK